MTTNWQSNLYYVGSWQVDSTSGEISCDGNTIQLEARTMRLLSYLVTRAGDVVRMEELLENVWPGLIVTPDSVYQAITTLRRAFGDDPKRSSYIATVPRFGYRLIAKVELLQKTSDVRSHESAAVEVVPDFSSTAIQEHVPGSAKNPVRPRSMLLASICAAILATVSLFTWVHATRPGGQKVNTSTDATSVNASNIATQPRTANSVRTVAVLPLLDQTEQMNEEPFADGMTDELINKLSKAPGLSVASALSSFAYKDKPVNLKEVANALHVAFILDGSVRKSGTTLRVSARLTRVQDGFVIWSETYDRSWHDKLMIQDDIANEVTRALATSIN